MRLRFTLAALMGLVVLAALGMAMFKDPSPFFSSALFTLDVALFGFATLGALARRGDERMPWIGFAFFGWLHLSLSFGPLGDKIPTSASPLFLMTWMLEQLSFLSNMPVSRVVIGSIPPNISVEFRQIGNSLSALPFAILGGVLGRLAVPQAGRASGTVGR